MSFENLLKNKKKQHNDALLNMLLASVKSQRDFWEAVHKVSFKRKFVRNDIAADDWFQKKKKRLTMMTLQTVLLLMMMMKITL